MRVVTMYSLTSSRPLCHLWLLSYFLAVSFALWFQLSFPYVQLYLQPHISHKLPYSSAYSASKYIRFQTEVIIFSPKSFLFLFFFTFFFNPLLRFFFLFVLSSHLNQKSTYYSTMPRFLSHPSSLLFTLLLSDITEVLISLHIWSHGYVSSKPGHFWM